MIKLQYYLLIIFICAYTGCAPIALNYLLPFWKTSSIDSIDSGSSGGGGAPTQQYMHIGGKATFGFSTNPQFAHTFIGPATTQKDLYVDSTDGIIYYAFDTYVERYNLSTGASMGAIGLASFYVSPSSNCLLNSAQTGWCTGGAFTTLFSSVTMTDGSFNGIQDIEVDHTNNILYVFDGEARVQKFNLTTGAFIGAIGNTTASTGTCAAAGSQSSWCTGGSFSSSTGDGAFDGNNNGAGSSGLAVDSVAQILYVLNGYRIQKFNAATGAFIGAVGETSSATGTCASGVQATWCTGGTFQSSTSDGGYSQGGRIAIDKTNGFLFTINRGSRQSVDKLSLATGAFIGAIGNAFASSGTCNAGTTQTGWCTGGSFTSGSTDGAFLDISGIAVDVTNNLFFVTEAGNHRVQKFTLSTGAVIGAIGKSTAAGTCLSGGQSTWCTGGSFSEASFVAEIAGFIIGGFSSPAALFVDSGHLYVGGAKPMQIFTSSSGAFERALSAVYLPINQWDVVEAGEMPAINFSFSYYFTDLNLDTDNNLMYVSTGTGGINKLRISTAEHLSSIGYSLVTSGTCTTGGQAGWCSGGVMLGNGIDGVGGPAALDKAHDVMYVAGDGKVSRFTLSTGAFVGSIGETTASSGSCGAAGVQSAWCTGGTFNQRGSYDLDGAFAYVGSVAFSAASGTLYVLEDSKISKYLVDSVSATLVGSIGNTTATSGSCAATGAQTTWCKGGTFTSGASDGMLNHAFNVKLDSTNNILYIFDAGNFRIQKFNAITGAFIGAIGNTSATSGSCAATGAQTGWCTGGTFARGSSDGMFGGSLGYVFIDTSRNEMLVSDAPNSRVQKFNLTTGAFEGAIGYVPTASGTCTAGVQSTWCTGGNFKAGIIDGAFLTPMSIARDPSTGYLYVGDGYLARVVRITGL